jgi:hypothetical protein
MVAALDVIGEEPRLAVRALHLERGHGVVGHLREELALVVRAEAEGRALAAEVRVGVDHH